jgi:hypothetical protein
MPGDEQSHQLTCGEIIRSELAGKNAAIASYVDILWKIRSGYVAATGAILAFSPDTAVRNALPAGGLVLLLLGLAVLAVVLDYTYSKRQLRVVRSYNRLLRHAYARAAHAAPADMQGASHFGAHLLEPHQLIEELQITGEPKPHGASRWLMWVPCLLYVPAIVVCSVLVTRQVGRHKAEAQRGVAADTAAQSTNPRQDPSGPPRR